MAALPETLSPTFQRDLTDDGAVIWAAARAIGCELSAIEANDIAERVAPIFKDQGVFDYLLRPKSITQEAA